MKPDLDLSAYLVLDVAACGAQDPVDVARAAVRGGVRCIQLRHKMATTDMRVALGRDLRAALAPYPCHLIVNDDVAAAVAIAADGAHVGQSDMSPREARALIGPNRILGLSIETVAQCAAIDADLVDHVGIGPIRATATKTDAAKPLGWDGLTAAIQASPVPAVAIGGVKPQDAGHVLRAGAVGMAVVSAICGQPDPESAARDLVQALAQAKAPVQ